MYYSFAIFRAFIAAFRIRVSKWVLNSKSRDGAHRFMYYYYTYTRYARATEIRLSVRSKTEIYKAMVFFLKYIFYSLVIARISVLEIVLGTLYCERLIPVIYSHWIGFTADALFFLKFLFPVKFVDLNLKTFFL